MRTNYIGHDNVYKKKKTEGMPGWATAEQIQENIARLKELLQAKYVPKSGNLLELGCGAGDLTLWLAEKGYNAYGVDISPAAIAWAQEKAKERNIKADFRVGSVLDLKDFPDDFFDFVLDGYCFHCIIGEDRKLFLASARRVLKPGGFFHVRTMCGGDLRDLENDFDPESRCLIQNGIASRYIGLPEDILDEIRYADFHILRWEVKTRIDKEDNDDLLVDATIP